MERSLFVGLLVSSSSSQFLNFRVRTTSWLSPKKERGKKKEIRPPPPPPRIRETPPFAHTRRSRGEVCLLISQASRNRQKKKKDSHKKKPNFLNNNNLGFKSEFKKGLRGGGGNNWILNFCKGRKKHAPTVQLWVRIPNRRRHTHSFSPYILFLFFPIRFLGKGDLMCSISPPLRPLCTGWKERWYLSWEKGRGNRSRNKIQQLLRHNNCNKLFWGHVNTRSYVNFKYFKGNIYFPCISLSNPVPHSGWHLTCTFSLRQAGLLTEPRLWNGAGSEREKNQKQTRPVPYWPPTNALFAQKGEKRWCKKGFFVWNVTFDAKKFFE